MQKKKKLYIFIYYKLCSINLQYILFSFNLGWNMMLSLGQLLLFNSNLNGHPVTWSTVDTTNNQIITVFCCSADQIPLNKRLALLVHTEVLHLMFVVSSSIQLRRVFEPRSSALLRSCCLETLMTPSLCDCCCCSMFHLHINKSNWLQSSEIVN